jgi:hypothetical protein
MGCATESRRYKGLQRVGVRGVPVKRKYISLLLKAMETFKGKGRNCGKVCGYKAADCKKRKGELHGGRGNSDGGGSTSLNIKCNFCGLKGHKEAECYKKFPEKAPTWYKEKAATSKNEAASSSVEVSLMSLVPGKLGIDVPAEKGHDALAIFCQENLWLCDTGGQHTCDEVQHWGKERS